MKSTLNKATRTFADVLARLNVGVTTQKTLERLLQESRSHHDLNFLRAMPGHHLEALMRLLPLSKSQLRQDLVCLLINDFKSNGYFVEFGATDGVALSNTHILEKEFGWSGILAEPAQCWQDHLHANRACNISNKCVWKASGDTLQFTEEHDPANSGVKASARFLNLRRGRIYDVSTLSLMDLLKQFCAPKVIDYLSVDTEGTEFEILSAFDFEQYKFRVITCEHNYSINRSRIQQLLASNGYERIFPQISHFDDWYILPQLTEHAVLQSTENTPIAL